MNLDKLVNGKKFMPENCLVVARVGVSVKGGQLFERAPTVVLGPLFPEELCFDMLLVFFS